MADDLNNRRHVAADTEWQNYQSGEGPPEAANGWQWETPGTEISRAVFFPDINNPEGPTLKGHFSVHFASPDGAAVTDAYASLNGEDVGARAKPEPPQAETVRPTKRPVRPHTKRRKVCFWGLSRRGRS